MITLVFDTETTGLVDTLLVAHERQPEIIEWASIAVDLDSGEIVSEYETLVRPTFLPLPEKIVKITGIQDADLEGAPVFPLVADRIREEIEHSESVLAHNARYDVERVDVDFSRHKLATVVWPWQIICTVEQTAHYVGKRLSLSDLHRYILREPHIGAHRAMADVKALTRIAVEMRRRGDL